MSVFFVDAMKLVAMGVNALRDAGRSFLVITHYQRLLDHIKPDIVHIMADGRIIKSGGPELALQVENSGYADLLTGDLHQVRQRPAQLRLTIEVWMVQISNMMQ